MIHVMISNVHPLVSGGALAARAAPALVSLSLASCASVAWLPRVDSARGESRNVQTIAQTAEEMPEGSATDVKAFFMFDLPPGLSLRYAGRPPWGSGGVLLYDSQKYEMLGTVAAEPAERFFYPYREKWRRPFCYPQQVLVVATLFLWGGVPTYWPCGVAPTSGALSEPDSEQRDRIVEALKRATKAMGGNLVVIRGFGSSSVNFFYGAHPVGFGYAIKVKAPPSPAPVSPGLTL
jgi:hypothetical protein